MREGPHQRFVDAGTTGDRGDVIFAAPEEISAIIEKKC